MDSPTSAHAAGGGANLTQKGNAGKVAADILEDGFHQEGGDGGIRQTAHGLITPGKFQAEYGEGCEGQKQRADSF